MPFPRNKEHYIRCKQTNSESHRHTTPRITKQPLLQLSCEQRQKIECKYNVTLRRIHEVIVAVEKQNVLYISVCACVCAWLRGCGFTGACLRACSFNYPAWKAQPHCHLRPLRLQHIFRHYIIIRKKVTENKMCFDFLYNFYFKYFSL